MQQRSLDEIIAANAERKREEERIAAENKRRMLGQLDPAQQQARDTVVGGADQQLAPSTTVPQSVKFGDERVDPFPALEQRNVMGTMVPVMEREFDDPILESTLDFQVKTEARPIVKDISQVTPYAFLQDVPGLDFSTAEAKRDFQNAKGVINAAGQFLPFSRLDDSFDVRIDAANKFGAMVIVDKNNVERPVDWTSYLLQETTIPDVETTIIKESTIFDAKLEDGRVVPGGEIEFVRTSDMDDEQLENYVNTRMLTSLNLYNDDVARPIYAHVLKKRLKALGVDDPRVVLSVIKYAQSKAGMGDMEKILSTAVEGNFKMPVQFGLFAAGEAIDTVDEIFTSVAGEDNEDSYWDIRSSERRQTILDNAWIPATELFIARMAQAGVTVPLYAAEEYMNTYTGWAPRIANIAGLVLPFSKALQLRSAFSNKAAYLEFERFLGQELAKGRVKPGASAEQAEIANKLAQRSVDDILKLYVDIKPNLKTVTPDALRAAQNAVKLGRATDAQTKIAKAKVGDIVTLDDAVAPPTLTERLRKSRLNNRILRGIQQIDAAQQPAFRAEVVRQQKYINGLTARKQGIQKRVELGTATAADRNRLFVLEKDILEQTAKLAGIERRSATPKWMRDVNIADNFIVLGMGTGGHIFQQVEPDSESPFMSSTYTGELVGLGAGIAASVLSAVKNPAASYFFRTNLGRLAMQRIGGKEAYRDWFTKNISQFSPEFQEALIARGDYIDQTFDPLIAAGVPEEQISMSLAAMTTLVGHTALADVVKMTIGLGDVSGDARSIETLQQLATSKLYMVEQLRSVLFDLEAPSLSQLESLDPNQTAYNQFYQMVNIAVTEGQASVDDLKKAINIAGKDGLQVQKDNLTQAFSFYKGDNGAGALNLSVDEALEILHNENLIEGAGLPKQEYKLLADKISENITKTVKHVADTITAELGSLEKARLKLKEFRDTNYPGGIIAQGADKPSLITGAQNEGELLAILFEAEHSSQKSQAKLGYQRFGTESNPATFYLSDKTPVAQGSAFVDAGALFDTLFVEKAPGITKSRQLAKEGISVGERKVNEAIFKQLSEPFFMSLADDGESVNDVVAQMVKAAEAEGMKFSPSEDLQIQLIRMLRDAANKEEVPEGTMASQIFNLSFNQLREFDRGIQALRGRVASGDDLLVLDSVSSQIDELATQFQVKTLDGQTLAMQELFLMDKAGNLQSTTQVLAQANADWLGYKSRWYDKGSVVPRWMSWGNRNKAEMELINDPVGIKYGNGDPITWLDMGSILGMSDLQKTKLVNDITTAIGSSVEIPTSTGKQRVFKKGDAATEVFASIFRAKMARYLLTQDKDLVPGDAIKQMNSLASTFVMRTESGEIVPIINGGNVFDDTLGYSQNSVGAEVFLREMKNADDELRLAVEKQLDPAAQHIAAKELSVNFLRRYLGENTPDEQIANALVSGGSNLIAKVKLELRQNGSFSDDQINAVLANVYLDSIYSRVFKQEPKKVIASTRAGPGGQVSSPQVINEVTTNVEALSEALGLNNPTRSAIVRELIGEERYNIWQSTAKILTELEDGSSSTFAAGRASVTGIPRAMALESHMARLFAWQRHAVGLKWIATENAIQHARLKNYNMVASALVDPEFGEMFLEIIRTGRPLSTDRDKFFRRSLVNSAAFWTAQSQLLMREKEVKDVYGIPAKVNEGGKGRGEIQKRIQPVMSKKALDVIGSVLPTPKEAIVDLRDTAAGVVTTPLFIGKKAVDATTEALFGPPKN